MRAFLVFIALLFATSGRAQHVDTLRFHSSAFGAERMITVHTPEFFRYASEEVKLPVIVLLDGQHDWFMGPVLNDIRYLQYTHEVPQAIVVTVPLQDRVAECAPDSFGEPTMPLLRLLTEELPLLLKTYHPGDLTVLVGHSFSASFALYAFVHAPTAFDAVIALSPAHQVAESIPQAAAITESDPNTRVLLAVGGPERLKDGGHHALLMPVLQGLERDGGYERLFVRQYFSAGHTSLPIIAFPELLATLFAPFSLRDALAPVDLEYTLLSPPPPPEKLLAQVDSACSFMGQQIPWEVAEINGLASRVDHSGYRDHTRAIYERAVQLYPRLWEFHASLGELLMEQDREAAQEEFREALRLLDTEESSLPERAEWQREIEGLME